MATTTYGLQLFDSAGLLELDSSSSINAGVFVTSITIPLTGSSTILFNGQAQGSFGTLPNLVGRTIFWITLLNGDQDIRLYTSPESYPGIQYSQLSSSNLGTRRTSTILVFVR